MKGLLNGQTFEYHDLTWAQLCNPALVLMPEPEVDLVSPPKMNEDAAREHDKALEDLARFCNEYGLKR